MTSYVDNMRRYARVDRGSGRDVTGRWSHLLADEPAELAAFAARLGLRPEWIQFPGTAWEHYEIVEAVRRRAAAAGAIPISYPGGTDNLVATKRLQASALDAASRGWQVFPLRPGTKIPALRDWEHQATADPERIGDLWTVRLERGGWYVPEPRNAGIACGPSGLVVIDLDLAKVPEDGARLPKQWWNPDIASGAEVLAALADQAGHAVPDTYTVATASGGRHLYFTAPDGVHLRNSAGRLGPMIDVRGQGGYVVAASSRLHPRWDDSTAEPSPLTYRLLEDRPAAELPGWLTAALAADRSQDENPTAGRRQIEGNTRQALDGRSESYGAAALRGEVDRVRSAPVGRRNHALNAAAYSLGQLIAAGALHQERVVEALSLAAAAAGLETAEITATIESGLRAGARRPRVIAARRSGGHQTEPTATAGLRRSDTRDIERADDLAPAATDSCQGDHSGQQGRLGGLR